MKEMKELFDSYQKKLVEARKEFHKRIIGQDELFDCMLICLFSKGLELNFHILLEGVPGVAKTVAINTAAKLLDIKFGRVTMFPEKMPSDIIGFEKLNRKTDEIEVVKGPIFNNILMANEINRASGKTQNALLEGMQEGQVTIGDKTYFLPQPFLVMADQNPLEHRDTYPLGAAQLDRFLMKLSIGYPTEEEEIKIAKLHQGSFKYEIRKIMDAKDILDIRNFIEQEICLDECLVGYGVKIVRGTRPEFSNLGKIMDEKIGDLLKCGASPRASIFLGIAAKVHAFLKGKKHVVPTDVEYMAQYILPHRLTLQDGQPNDPSIPPQIIKEIVERVAENERPKINPS